MDEMNKIFSIKVLQFSHENRWIKGNCKQIICIIIKKKTFNGHSGGHADVRTTDKSLIIILLRDLFETQFLYKHKLINQENEYFSKYLLSL